VELERGVTTRFTFDAAADRHPLWSPDGGEILFHSNRKGFAYDFYKKSSSGAGTEELVFQSSDSKYPRDWSRDGRFLVYSSFPVGGQGEATADLWVLPLTGDRKPFAFLQTKFEETQPRFAPDGKWIAYVSNDSGRDEVYVQTFPTPGSKRQVSVGGGRQPSWRDDGKELFYLSPDRKLMAAPISTGQTLEAGTPQVLFQTPFNLPVLSASASYQYDVAPGGQRFLMLVPPGDATVPITVVLNWTAGLKQH
jgi:Tol biopolymer transport system component